jgi:S-adenosylmethionine hydrolase
MREVKRPVIALLSDFGESDYFVASMKAVMLGINPDLRFIDITHRLPAFDPAAAAFVLWAAFRYFPKGTIFLAVVDPGVGTARKVLVAETGDGYFFVAPDNGILTRVLKQDPPRRLHALTERAYALSEPTRTFEGRDRMAPAAAWLSRGVDCDDFGPRCVSYVMLETKGPRRTKRGLRGRIIYTDAFGNAITDIPEAWVRDLMGEDTPGPSCLVGKERIPLKGSYSEAARGDPLCLIGSVGLIEIAVREGSAVKRLGLRIGDRVAVVPASSSDSVTRESG